MSRSVPIFKRCGCTEVVDGKRRQLGARCPKLRRRDGSWNPRHGTWTFTASHQVKGRRRPVTRGGFATYEEAERALTAMREQLSTGRPVAGRLTVSGWLDEWMAAKTDIKRSTLHGYRQHIERWLRPELGHIRLTELRTAHVADALAAVSSSAANRQRVRATLRVALNDAVREGLLSVNPAALVKLPSGKRPKAYVWTTERVERWRRSGEQPSPVMVWTADQLGAFLDVASNDRLYALWHLIAHRGLRRGEACGVSWSDVDLEAGALTVRRQLVQIGWEVDEDDPKSDAGGRTVALDAGTVAALRTWRRHQFTERLAWGEVWSDTGRVFTREDGSDLHPATVTDQFHRLRGDADLPPVRLHDLRHGAASLMLAAGVDLKVVSETLGHSTTALTADTYTSVYSEVAAEAAERAAALVPRKHTGTDTRTSHTHSPRTESGRLRPASRPAETSGAGGTRTHDLTDYESAALPAELLPPRGHSCLTRSCAADGSLRAASG